MGVGNKSALLHFSIQLLYGFFLFGEYKLYVLCVEIIRSGNQYWHEVIYFAVV